MCPEYIAFLRDPPCTLTFVNKQLDLTYYGTLAIRVTHDEDYPGVHGKR